MGQERWNNNTLKGQWTKELIPNLGKWIECEHTSIPQLPQVKLTCNIASASSRRKILTFIFHYNIFNSIVLNRSTNTRTHTQLNRCGIACRHNNVSSIKRRSITNAFIILPHFNVSRSVIFNLTFHPKRFPANVMCLSVWI